MDTDREHSEQQMKQSRWGFRGKTVWNWLELLVVPLALAVIGLAFSVQQDARQQRFEDQRAEAELELAEQRAQDEALQAYLDQMSQLMLDRKLLEAEQGDPVHTLAQARTSTIILRLDAEHNESVTRFLSNSGLAASSETSPRLLRDITLPGATLSDAHLEDADLHEADLKGADLSAAFLVNADLSDGYLVNADLSGAVLGNADLSDAVLTNADLSCAREVAILCITNKEVAQQTNDLNEATMPNGQKYEDWLSATDYFAATEFEPVFQYNEVGGEWSEKSMDPVTPDFVLIHRKNELEDGQLLFTNPSDIFDLSNLSEPKVLPAPENAEEWVSWLQSHPYLDTSKPVPASVGGASGMRIDVTLATKPEDYPRDVCGEQPCVPLYPLINQDGILSIAGYKDRFVIVDVEGEMVVIDVAAPADQFDEFAPKAEKLLEVVEWVGG